MRVSQSVMVMFTTFCPGLALLRVGVVGKYQGGQGGYS